MTWNSVKTTILLAALTALILLIGNWLGGSGGLVLAFLIAVVMNASAYWFSDKIVLKGYGAQEVSENQAPELYAMVRRLCRKAQLPLPKVYIVPNETPNAFATGRNPDHAAVAVTEGILRVLSAEELEGVLAHELAHVRNRDILISSIAATLAGAIMMIAHWAQWAALFGFGGRDDDDDGGGALGLVAMAIVAPLAATLIQMGISRSREYLADETGARICGSPRGLAHALEKLHIAGQRIPMREASPATAHLFIVNPLSGQSLMSLFSTHPPIEKRIARLLALT
ncbi:MAG: zinc metalloprotease HtpX [Nitrospinota bacterium]